jgi:FAD/FMN-containing dehydrogenase
MSFKISSKARSWVSIFLSFTLVARGAPNSPSERAYQHHPRQTYSHDSACRYLPGDRAYPSQAEWNALNRTVGGRLIMIHPLGQVCYGATRNIGACDSLKQDWANEYIYLNDPAHIMAPYWQNNSCSPFYGPTGPCELGDVASYAINVASADDVVAGLRFVKEKNIRLVIKNTGHDTLGRAGGTGALALWTHNLKSVSFISHYTSPGYNGRALRAGAGIQVHELYAAADASGVRVVGGSCPTVGATGGWLAGGGHGPLQGAYGLGADNVLEFEVVTAAGKHLTASSTRNQDLFWALAGGGAGNYAVVLSVTLKAHPGGPVAGSRLLFANTNPDAYWTAVTSWLRHLSVLDAQYPALRTSVTLSNDVFFLDFATFPDRTAAQLTAALQPFYQELTRLNITLLQNETAAHGGFLAHYDHFSAGKTWTTNTTLGSRFFPRAVVRDNVAGVVASLRGIAERTTAGGFIILGGNVSYAKVGGRAGGNAVVPAWRDALFLLNFGLFSPPDAGWGLLRDQQAEVDRWLEEFKALTPGSGGYGNEGSFTDSDWKLDYYGSNYERLLNVKRKYDPDHLFWAITGVGSDEYELEGDGRLCRIS